MTRRFPIFAHAVACAALGGCTISIPSHQLGGGDPDAGPRAGADAAPTAPDAGGDSASVRDDSAAEFQAGDPKLAGVSIDPAGRIAPAAYRTGGLLLRASDSASFGAAQGATWAQVSALAPTAHRSLLDSTVIDFGTGVPAGLGLGASGGDQWALWAEGEVYLDAGTWSFALLADDHAFVELAAPATASFVRVVSANWPTEASASFVATTAGWYPIRVALAEEVGNASLQLRLGGGPAAAPLAAIARQRLRYPVSELRGLELSGWDDSDELGPSATTIDQVSPASYDFGLGAPADLAIVDGDEYSTRWAGQVHLDVAGDYSFRLVSDDGQRLWLDGQPLIDAWDRATHDTVTTPRHFEAGWHDVVVEHQEAGGAAQVHLTIASGPAGAGAPLAVDHTRPVVGRTARSQSWVSPFLYGLADASQNDFVFTLDGDAEAAIAGIEVGYTASHTRPADLEVRLIAPDGYYYYWAPAAAGAAEHVAISFFDGKAPGGTWRLRVTDKVANGQIGTIDTPSVTIHYAGGVRPIEPAGSYESSIRDLGASSQIARVDYQASAPAGSAVLIRLRTGDTIDAVRAATWSEPVAPGGAPAMGLGRYVQYRVELGSDGIASAELDSIALTVAGKKPE